MEGELQRVKRGHFEPIMIYLFDDILLIACHDDSSDKLKVRKTLQNLNLTLEDSQGKKNKTFGKQKFILDVKRKRIVKFQNY